MTNDERTRLAVSIFQTLMASMPANEAGAEKLVDSKALISFLAQKSVAVLTVFESEIETIWPEPQSDPGLIELQLEILRNRYDELEDATSEQWQRDENPDLVQKKKELKAKITALENELLR